MLKIALFGNIYQREKAAHARLLLDTLHKHNAQVFIDREYCSFLSRQHILHEDEADGSTSRLSSFDDFAQLSACDFAISVGGDGTLLKTASRVGARQTPIIGINMGRLGFLADVSVDDIEASIAAVCQGDYSLEDRSLILVETNGEPIEGCPCALNDVAILKRDTASMISIRTSIDGEYLTTYQADGLIASTPTGSTAYSLSNGGPIIVPRTGVLLLTPVAPHSLNVRPIVIPDTALIELTVSSRSHTFLVGIDGRSSKLPEGTTLRLRRAPYVARIVKRSGTRYFTTLREKLMWGADIR